ncbi:hypothetical protein BDZ89DRAFT_1059500 [Hymenopellis radicata]|nr:hypothetical protein BDZ89DRAFT_1059500 [Hymenopellis radicata]
MRVEAHTSPQSDSESQCSEDDSTRACVSGVTLPIQPVARRVEVHPRRQHYVKRWGVL